MHAKHLKSPSLHDLAMWNLFPQWKHLLGAGGGGGIKGFFLGMGLHCFFLLTTLIHPSSGRGMIPLWSGGIDGLSLNRSAKERKRGAVEDFGGGAKEERVEKGFPGGGKG